VTRLPRAPEAPLPEVAEFLAPCTVHLVQGPGVRSLRPRGTGLLTERQAKRWPDGGSKPRYALPIRRLPPPRVYLL
jgi:hypothetical protein